MKYKLIISLVFACIVQAVLWHSTSLPPHGPVINDWNSQYWGEVINIAHKIREGIYFWDREAFNGMSLFTSGLYPLLNPFNIFALIFDDHTFYRFILSAPYALGAFFSCLFFLDICRSHWLIALTGAAWYCTLHFAREAPMIRYPFFTWGCLLFPALIYFLAKLADERPRITMGIVGGLLALQFFCNGVIQIPQTVLWLMLYIIIDKGLWRINISGGERLFWLRMMGYLIFFFISLCAVQLIPTLIYYFTESASRVGHYTQINTLPIFPIPDSPFIPSVYSIVRDSFRNMMLTYKVVLLIILTMMVLRPQATFNFFKKNRFVQSMWIASLLYVLIPNITGLLVAILPAFKPIFEPLSSFSFKYGVHILDFSLITTVVMFITDKQIKLAFDLWSWQTKIYVALFIAVMGWITIRFIIPHSVKWMSFLPTLFEIVSLRDVFFIFWCLLEPLKEPILFILLCIVFPLRIHRKSVSFISFGLLITISFVNLDAAYRQEFDQRTHRIAKESFPFRHPEYQYFQQARGQYFMPCPSAELSTMLNYPLLYGVYGISGFFDLLPAKYTHFTAWSDCVNVKAPTEALPNIFPVDFTFIHKGNASPWPGFVKVIDGVRYDVWINTNKLRPVEVVTQPIPIATADMPERINFLQPHQYMIDPKDAKIDSLPEGKGRVSHYVNNGDTIKFRLNLENKSIIRVLENNLTGWKVRIDGKDVPLFPVNYFYIGFMAPPGEHHVQVIFRPPGLILGLLINIIGVLVFLCWCYRYQYDRRPF